MTALLDQLAAALAAVGLLAGALVALTTRQVLPAVGMLLDFLLAAGLLRLVSLETWVAIPTVAAVVVLRKVAVTGPPLGGGQSRAWSSMASYGARPRTSLSK